MSLLGKLLGLRRHPGSYAFPLQRSQERDYRAGYEGDVFYWDIDKTYLETDHESLAGLAAVTWEMAVDKRQVAATDVLLRALRRGAPPVNRVWSNPLYFVSASPPQLRAVIERKMLIDLRPYVNTAPFIIHETASVPRAYDMFRQLTLRHLIVVDADMQVSGIVTRHDLLTVHEVIKKGGAKAWAVAASGNPVFEEPEAALGSHTPYGRRLNIQEDGATRFMSPGFRRGRADSAAYSDHRGSPLLPENARSDDF